MFPKHGDLMYKYGRWDGLNHFFEWISGWVAMVVLMSYAELVSPLPPLVTLFIAVYFTFRAIDKGYGAFAIMGLALFLSPAWMNTPDAMDASRYPWLTGLLMWFAGVLMSYGVHKRLIMLLRRKYTPAGDF